MIRFISLRFDSVLDSILINLAKIRVRVGPIHFSQGIKSLSTNAVNIQGNRSPVALLLEAKN